MWANGQGYVADQVVNTSQLPIALDLLHNLRRVAADKTIVSHGAVIQAAWLSIPQRRYLTYTRMNAASASYPRPTIAPRLRFQALQDTATEANRLRSSSPPQHLHWMAPPAESQLGPGR